MGQYLNSKIEALCHQGQMHILTLGHQKKRVNLKQADALYNKLSYTAGCFMVYSDGCSQIERKARIRLIGRERDVENSCYLVSYVANALERHVTAYRRQLKAEGHSQINLWVKSYRLGFIDKIYERILANQQAFFTSTNTKALVCVDSETRREDARKFCEEQFGSRLMDVHQKSRYIKEAVRSGFSDASTVQINQAVNQQTDIKSLTN